MTITATDTHLTSTDESREIEASKRAFIRRASVIGVGGLATSLLSACAGGSDNPASATPVATIPPAPAACVNAVTPAVPEGPYYKDEKLNRTDVREDRIGIPITYVFTVQDTQCRPIKDAVVDIWQCDKDGVYSDFAAQNTLGQTWLRGFQLTDAAGQCRFTAIFPGWYNGRLTHLHAKLFVGGVLKQTTNFFYPKSVETEAYQDPRYTKGQNPTTVAADIELRGDTARFTTLSMSVAKDPAGGYIATYTLGFVA